jgi:dCMP deaminase
MTRSSWDTVWADVAWAVSRRSACIRAQVGAVLVHKNRVVSTGYNGPASGYPANTDRGCTSWCPRSAGQPASTDGYGFSCPSIHAEANALLYRHWGVQDMTLYVTHAPCADCAKLISNAGVTRVVMLRAPEAHRPDPTPYLRSCGIQVDIQ